MRSETLYGGPISGLLARWPLARVLMLILAGAFLGLMTDIRVEHVDIVRETPVAWTPIVYSAAMAVACIVAAFLWNSAARLVMRIGFLVAFVVGGLGFYFHNRGHFGDVITGSVSAWFDSQMEHPGGPPHTAPLAFAGLGLLGGVATLRRFN